MKNQKKISIVPIILTVFIAVFITNVVSVFAKPSLTITTAAFPPFKFLKERGFRVAKAFRKRAFSKKVYKSGTLLKPT